MSQLFTVTMEREHRVKKYDDKGKLVAEVATKIPIVFHDLPAQTAQMYRSKFPDANVRIMHQAIERDTSAREKLGGGGFKKREREVYVAAATEPAPRTSIAATTGDMSAAINAELEASK